MAGFCSSLIPSYLGQYRGQYHNGPKLEPFYWLNPRARPWMDRILTELSDA